MGAAIRVIAFLGVRQVGFSHVIDKAGNKLHEVKLHVPVRPTAPRNCSAEARGLQSAE
jgi:hypothetical protein